MQTLVIAGATLAATALATRLVGALAPVSRGVKRALRIGNIIAAAAAVAVAGTALVTIPAQAAASPTPTGTLALCGMLTFVFGAAALFTALPYDSGSATAAATETRSTAATSGSDDATMLAMNTAIAIDLMTAIDTSNGGGVF